MENVTV